MSPILGIVASQNYVRIPPSSYESIATATGTGSSSTITFSSIPSTYKSLQIRLLTRSTGSFIGGAIALQLNSDTGSNYTRHFLKGDGSAAAAFGATSQTSARINDASPGNNALANAMGVSIVDLHDYASSTKNKTIRAFSGMDLNSADGEIYLQSSVWLNTNAVTSISIFSTSGNLTTSTVISLYGIKGA